MDKELKKLLEEIKERLSKKDKLETLSDLLDKALKEKTIISIEKDTKGKSTINVEGNRLSLLVTLAALEKSILEQLDCDSIEFDFIKTITGTKEAD